MVFLVTVSLLLTYLNYRGLNVVGQTAMTTTLFIITPFVLLCVLAAPHVEPTNWLQVGGRRPTSREGQGCQVCSDQ
jgi:amino acid transporter